MMEPEQPRSILTRRSFVGGGAAAAAAAGPARIEAADEALKLFTPEMFGAAGDGRSNDTLAMAKLAAAVRANRGGRIEFAPKTYLVGAQIPRGNASYRFEPIPLLEFVRCTRGLILRGNGARIRCAPGLRYGVFDAAGTPERHPMPYLGGGLATPYRWMIKVEECAGRVEISDLELDGNVAALQIGGPYGDTGWQIPAVGLALVNNSGPELVRNVYAHHHAQDGLSIDGLEAEQGRRVARTIIQVRTEGNGRQGCSIVGGRGYRFERCRFERTGRSSVSSAPGAGVDIEAEGGKKIRDLAFSDCTFSDNAGCGLVADTGDSADAAFVRCSFIGTTNWSAWPNKPRFRFRDCRFVGPLVRAYGAADPAEAAQFTNCLFSDDPALSPTRQVYGGENRDRPLADLSDARNMLFSGCTFLATHGGVLPWSTGAIYENCRMEQTKRVHGFPRGTYRGRNVINGLVDLYGSRNLGEVVVNGKTFRNGWSGA